MKHFKFLMVFSLIFILTACKNHVKEVKDENELKEESSTETIIVDSHTSRNSLDWPGMYKGILPCADCEGIETILEINMDNTYNLKTTYLGKEENIFEESGSFSWNNLGSIISLDNQEPPNKYRVEENQIRHLDMDGKVISGDLSEFYVLRKH